MGRKREISSEQATVLAGLGHKIHYFYDPSEAVGRPNGKVAATRRKRLKRRVRKAPKRIEMTGRLLSKSMRASGLSIVQVYDACTKIIGARSRRDAMGRSLLCRLIAKELDRTEKAIQVQVSKLIKLGHMKQFKDATT